MEIKDIERFRFLDLLQSNIGKHYELYSKKMLANIIYTLIDMYIDIIGEKDREEYKLFIECLKNNEKYVD